MKRKSFWSGIAGLISFLLISTSGAFGGTLEAMSTTGVMDDGGTVPLQGDATSGDLVQLIWIGPDGAIDPAESLLGNPSDDDSLLGTTYIGYGYPFEPNSGKFSKTFDHVLLAEGNIVYMRAFNNPTIVAGMTLYGDSEPYQIGGVAGYDSHDFGTWQTNSPVVPVELTSFKAIAEEGRILLQWTTRSETNNLGFNVLRSQDNSLSNAQVINPELIEGKTESKSGRSYEYIDTFVEEESLYYYWLEDVSLNGAKTYNGPKSAKALLVPKQYALFENHPNPFNPSTTIQYQLKDDGQVRICIYNIMGQLVRQLVDENRRQGTHTVIWDGLDNRYIPAPSGMYVYTIEVNDFRASRKMMLTK